MYVFEGIEKEKERESVCVFVCACEGDREKKYVSMYREQERRNLKNIFFDGHSSGRSCGVFIFLLILLLIVQGL